ncbi:hypothetical protein CFP56_000705 [Quercus suber]
MATVTSALIAKAGVVLG